MASPITRDNGIGGTAGAELVSLAPLSTSGAIHYVHSSTGDDSYAGTDRIRPLATLAQAHTNASAGDIIVCLSGHSESISSAITFSKAQILVLGECATEATAPRFTRTADINMFDVTAAGVRFHKLYFPISTTAASAKSRVRIATAGCQVVDCYFDHGAQDDGPGVELITGAGNIRIQGTRFTSTISSAADQPDTAIEVTNAVTHLDLDTVVLDGGSSGWANPYAFNGAAAVTGLFGVNVDLLNGSDITLATGTTGYIHRRNKSGSANIVWTA